MNIDTCQLFESYTRANCLARSGARKIPWFSSRDFPSAP